MHAVCISYKITPPQKKTSGNIRNTSLPAQRKGQRWPTLFGLLTGGRSGETDAEAELSRPTRSQSALEHFRCALELEPQTQTLS